VFGATGALPSEVGLLLLDWEAVVSLAECPTWFPNGLPDQKICLQTQGSERLWHQQGARKPRK